MPTTKKAPAANAANTAPEKPKSTRRRAATKRKPAAAAASKAKKTPTRKRAPRKSATRSKAAIAKLQSAIDQLEEALQSAEVADAAIPAPPLAAIPAPPVQLKPLPPAAPKPRVEIQQESWTRAMRPALATCAFLVVVGALAVGYSTGRSVGTHSVGDSLTVVAEASELPASEAPAAEAAPAPEATPAVEKPSPLADPAPEPAQLRTASTQGGRSLHLQVSALKSRQAADRLGRRLQEEGFPVQVRDPETDGLVRVLVGPVDEGEQLTAMADRLREEGLKPFPRRL